ncbi:5'-nucleotidase domain-containing protein 1 [Cardiocondyla obscurior]|uniref:5'-nucleotidase domain-containing protein 1 n=1 Tax=Cardiocondyla obscurior TaxID=286306 RepID=UPI003965869A
MTAYTRTRAETPSSTTYSSCRRETSAASTSRQTSAKSIMDTFKFTDYDIIGFDLDNTLLRYNIMNLVHMEYKILATYLVEERGYSREHLLKPLTDDDLDFMQKGLLLDCEKGNVLRISPDGIIHRACHGTHLLNINQIKEIYPEQRWTVTDMFCRDMVATWNGPLSLKIRSLLDNFDIMSVVAFARAVDAFDEKHGSPRDYSFEYNIWPDILSGLVYLYSREHFQSDKGIFGIIKRHPEKYLRKCNSDTISWLKEVKKKSATFLLTGSNADFANFTASYSLGKDWRSLFDIVVCFAKKPGFFIYNRPFFDVVNNNETNIETQKLERGEIYSQGNWNKLLEFFIHITGKANQRCLYVGDSLLQDIYVPSAFTRFDTLAITEEQMSEGMLHHALTHPDEKILNSKLWGSFFCLKDSTVYVDSLWGHILKKHAKLCIPDLSVVVKRPLEEPIPCFDKDGKSYHGYYPAIPLSISAL